MDAYVARQPIFNKRRQIFAYELLFRDGTANYVPDIDGDTATATLLSNTFFAIGMDALTRGKKSFINFTENLLLKKVPLLLPRERIVVEILENVKPGPEIIDACREISEKGYVLALDDFEYHACLQPLITMANIIKFDFLLTPASEIRAYLNQLHHRRVVLLAEKVETYEDFIGAVKMGFELFQGYFFCKPEVIHDKEIPGNQLTLMQIMAEVSKQEFSLTALENLLSGDMGMSYKLLRYINSAFFAKANKISSLKQALVYMGESEIRRFVSLVAMSKLAKGKPAELLRLACIRGKFCEGVGELRQGTADPSELFTLGLFSLIDAVIDQPMSTIMDKLPLSGDIIAALTRRSGKFNDFLSLAHQYEQGDWNRVPEIAGRLGVDEAALPAIYLKACQWSDRISKL